MSKLPLPILIFLVALAGCSPDPAATPTLLQMQTISNRAHLASGGDILIEIQSTVPASDFELRLAGNASHSPFSQSGDDGEIYFYRSLIEGLPEGNSTLELRAGAARTALAVTNYPRSGPIFSGPHQEPYFCLSELAPDADGQVRGFVIGNGETLRPTGQDENCSLPTRIDYVYFSSADAGEFKALGDVDARPADLAMTTTLGGEQVPYIVRLETGTINRAIYQIAVLHDPSMEDPSALAPPANWNQRLVYTYGGGCEAGYFQGTVTGGVLRHNMLGAGYAVASSTLNVNAQGGCNDVISAETTMMVKEHFIENYGEPVYTIGRGSSGGAMQQLLIAGAYPGLLDGLLISNTFADAVTYFTDSQECASLLRETVNDLEIAERTRALIGGWPMWSLCDESLGERPKRIAPDDCPAAIPADNEYDPHANQDGVRCSIYDGMRNIFGEKVYAELDIDRMVARAPHDNVGVQYGLVALNQGLIDKELFLNINANIGGWDIDVNTRQQRTRADTDAVRIAYETGRVTSGAAGLAQVPIIDDRTYLDDIGNFHASVYSFITRARLERDNGHADNYILRRHGRELSLEADNLAQMDQWLASIRDSVDGTLDLETIVQAKPADLQNECYAASGERIAGVPHFDMNSLFDNTAGPCNSLYPPHAGLRLVAGGPLSNDVLKCQLKPIDDDDYEVEFTQAEKARLEEIFAAGVCDWDKPGVHQQTNATWLSFGPSPVNRYRLTD